MLLAQVGYMAERGVKGGMLLAVTLLAIDKKRAWRRLPGLPSAFLLPPTPPQSLPRNYLPFRIENLLYPFHYFNLFTDSRQIPEEGGLSKALFPFHIREFVNI